MARTPSQEAFQHGLQSICLERVCGGRGRDSPWLTHNASPGSSLNSDILTVWVCERISYNPALQRLPRKHSPGHAGLSVFVVYYINQIILHVFFCYLIFWVQFYVVLYNPIYLSFLLMIICRLFPVILFSNTNEAEQLFLRPQTLCVSFVECRL